MSDLYSPPFTIICLFLCCSRRNHQNTNVSKLPSQSSNVAIVNAITLQPPALPNSGYLSPSLISPPAVNLLARSSSMSMLSSPLVSPSMNGLQAPCFACGGMGICQQSAIMDRQTTILSSLLEILRRLPQPQLNMVPNMLSASPPSVIQNNMMVPISAQINPGLIPSALSFKPGLEHPSILRKSKALTIRISSAANPPETKQSQQTAPVPFVMEPLVEQCIRTGSMVKVSGVLVDIPFCKTDFHRS